MARLLMTLIEAVMILCGASCPEELDEDMLRRFEVLERNPVPINSASRSTLAASGLFSAFQTAVILDYRERTGDILSWMELSMLEGFGQQKAEALSRFVDFSSTGLPGQKRHRSYRDELYARYKSSTGDARVRYSGGIDGSLGFSLSSKGTGHLSLEKHGRTDAQLILGDFNARYGQGLLMWSGMVLSGYPGVESLMRRGTGLGASRSFSRDGRYRGLALSAGRGGWSLDGFADLRGRFGGSLGLYGRRSKLGLNALGGNGTAGLSADATVSIGGVTLFGECAYDAASRQVAFKGGLMGDRSYNFKYGALLRCLPDETGLAVAIKAWQVNASIDLMRKPSKGSSSVTALLYGKHPLTIGQWALNPGYRIKLKYSEGNAYPMKYSARLETAFTSGPWTAGLRYEASYCRGLGQLGYAELGWKHSDISVWLRGTLYGIPGWDDRIYVYERDVPEAFNVPAYYGSGWSASLLCRWKGLYLRIEKRKELSASLCCRIRLHRGKSPREHPSPPTQ